MTKFVLISDTHGQHGKLKLPHGDFLIHAGDWTRAGEIETTVSFLEWFESQPHTHKIFIAGNHDFMPEDKVTKFKRIKQICALHCTYLEDTSVTLDGFKIHGSPVSPEFHNWAFNRNEQNIQKHWDLIPSDVDILITHTPPYGFGDQLGANGSKPYEHVGCPYLWDKILTLDKLKLHVFGHIHCGYGMYDKGANVLGRMPIFVNACVLDENYRLRNDPIEIILDTPK